MCVLVVLTGERLHKLTQQFAASQTPLVTISASLALLIDRVNPLTPLRVNPSPERCLTVVFACVFLTGERLYKLTQQCAASQTPLVTISASLALSIDVVIHNPAYCGVLRKYLLRCEAEAAEKDDEMERLRHLGLLTLFGMYLYMSYAYTSIPRLHRRLICKDYTSTHAQRADSRVWVNPRLTLSVDARSPEISHIRGRGRPPRVVGFK